MQYHGIDKCDDCGAPISGGECWLGLCRGCEARLAEDPTRRVPVKPPAKGR